MDTMLNLIDKISDEDKEKFEVYMRNYSQAGKNYVGNTIFLADWAKNKIKLYKLLGEKLKVSFPYNYEKTEDVLRKEIINLCDGNFEHFPKFYIDFLDGLAVKGVITEHENHCFCMLIWTTPLVKDTVPVEATVKLKPEGYKKTLQINKGMKPIRAIQKIITYFKEDFPKERVDFTYEKLVEQYENFRIQHSLIFNEKIIKGVFTISIHPLDFVTMSNNSLGWTSCMEWSQDNPGCYHAGTIEMMNSNNVVCCYIEAKDLYKFYGNDKSDKCYYWNNKKWRSLAIVTPEIILSGKSYPYLNQGMTYTMLDKIKELAKENLGWDYTYGIEPYKDMIHINSTSAIDNNYRWIKQKKTTKHNIIVHTQGMYNDYLNANIDYYCYRNKVKKNTIITYSGKARCTCCGDEFLDWNGDFDIDYNYNERYSNTENDICNNCQDNLSCDICGEIDNRENISFIYDKDTGKRICKDCLTNIYRICPDCGMPYRRSAKDKLYYSVKHKRITEKLHSFLIPSYDIYNVNGSIQENKILTPLSACQECLENLQKKVKTEMLPTMWVYDSKPYIYKDMGEDFVKKYSWSQQQHITSEDYLKKLN